MGDVNVKPSSSFSTKRVNDTTFVILEDDEYKEHPLIYVKVHPKVPLIVLSDTGCDEPSKKHKHDDYIHLRKYIEQCPIECNDNKPLNPELIGGGHKQYYIICTHCHFDHVGGISQFLEGGTTEIIASGAGRDFIESDLQKNGHFDLVGATAPWYQVTCYAIAFEQLKWPIWHEDEEPEPYQVNLDMTIIQTPGHTPDELAWYDAAEMHLSCGDSFYEEGGESMPIIFLGESNLIEWVFSMQKLLVFVRSENSRAAKEAEDSKEIGWVQVAKRVKVSCAHQTYSVDGEEILARLESFSSRVFRGQVPIVKKELWNDDAYYTWRTKSNEEKMSIKAPARLMDDARRFFNLNVKQ